MQTADGYAANPGDLTTADLASYRARVRKPVCGQYRSYRVCGVPPPSSGGIAVLQMLGMLERFDMGSIGSSDLISAHLFSEAGRLAYADRDMYVADPDFIAVPAGLTDRAYLRERSRLIRLDSSIGYAAPGAPPPIAAADNAGFGRGEALELPSTSHISIVDRYGNAVAMTTTIEDAFGSKLMTAGGFLLNNELTDFSFVPAEGGRPVANRVEGGKRPRSAMAPTIVYDAQGRVTVVAGSPGGPAIINYVAKTLIAHTRLGLDPQTAVDLPNIGSRNGPTELERGTSAEALASKLEALGEATQIVDQNSGLQVIVRAAGALASAAPIRAAKGRYAVTDGQVRRLRARIGSSSSAAAPVACRWRPRSATSSAAPARRRSRWSIAPKPTCGNRCCTRSRPAAWMRPRTTSITSPSRTGIASVFAKARSRGLNRARRELKVGSVDDDDGRQILPERSRSVRHADFLRRQHDQRFRHSRRRRARDLAGHAAGRRALSPPPARRRGAC